MKKHFNFPDIFKKLGILLLVFFLFIFVTTKWSQNSQKKVLEKNLETIKNSAYQYYKEHNRPMEKNEEYTISLQDLIDDHYMEPLKDKKGNVCNASKSEVTISKKTSTKYNLNAYLSCPNMEDEKDYTLVYSDKDTVSESSNVYYKLQKEVITDNYQYSCPEGYTLNGKYCYASATTLFAEPIAKYKTYARKTMKPSYKKMDDIYEYVEPIEVIQKEEYTCPKNKTLVGNECLETRDYEIKKSCPSPYKKSGNRCVRVLYADTAWSDWNYVSTKTFSYEKSSDDYKRYQLEAVYRSNNKNKYVYQYFTREKDYVCPSDGVHEVQKKGTKCYYYTNLIDTKTCPTGYELSKDNSQCLKYSRAKVIEESISYICPTGYEKKGKGIHTECYKTTKQEGYYYCKNTDYRMDGDICVRDESTVFTGYKCPSGYDLNGKQCVKTISGNKISATKTNDPEIDLTYKWSNKPQESGWTFTGETKEF